MEPNVDHYKTWQGRNVKQLRELTIEFELPPNPFVRDAWTTKHLMFLNKTETSIEMAVIDDQKGFPYATSFEFYELWEIRTTDPRSKQVCVRHTYQLYWLDRPWIVDKIILKMAADKGLEAVQFFKQWSEN